MIKPSTLSLYVSYLALDMDTYYAKRDQLQGIRRRNARTYHWARDNPGDVPGEIPALLLTFSSCPIMTDCSDSNYTGLGVKFSAFISEHEGTYSKTVVRVCVFLVD